MNNNYQIIFGKDRFHQITEIEQWCTDNIGKGGWAFGGNIREDESWSDDYAWGIDSIFGNTTFTFKHYDHYILFALKWS